MKRIFFLTISLVFFQFAQAQNADTSTHLIIVTIDGLRWQEIFGGADEALLRNPKFTEDTATANMMFAGGDTDDARKRLMPFFWNVIAKKGQLYGNRRYDNKVNVANLYSVSYPGYNELFTGTTDLTIANNKKINNRNINIFEYLNARDLYKNRIGIFTSWNVLAFALNKQRSGLQMNCGYEALDAGDDQVLTAFNEVQGEMDHAPGTRQDMLTYIAAKEYLLKQQPKILYLGLGETDEYAHAGMYDTYLQKAYEADHIISELWHWVQATPGFKDNTTIIITTDHGRGSGKKWTSHGPFITGSSQTWVAMIGKNIEPLGEMKNEGQLYQKQFAQTIAYLLGERFGELEPMVNAGLGIRD